jgi:N-acetylglucosamine-6-phosphate deacetylase
LGRYTYHPYFQCHVALHHREPGILGAALADDRFTTEIIADGIHVHPGVVKLLVKAKGPAGITLITDSVGACGLPDGKYRFEEEEFVLKNGAALLEDGTLCGSVLTMERGAANLLAFGAAKTPNEALQMASLTPASVLHFEDRMGQIKPGMHADLVAFDDQFKIHWTMVGGKIVYHSAA